VTHYKFGLRKKLVLFITALALITYTTSGVCIYVLYPLFFNEWNETVFAFGTLALGIIWSGVLAFFAAGLIVNPLRRLEKVALKAAVGDIREDVDVSKTDDEIRALGKAFNLMLCNLREMVNTIDENFTETNEKVIHISSKSSHVAEPLTVRLRKYLKVQIVRRYPFRIQLNLSKMSFGLRRKSKRKQIALRLRM